MCLATVAAAAAVVARSLSPGGFGENSSTAAVPAIEASHHPASRDGIVPGSASPATGRT